MGRAVRRRGEDLRLVRLLTTKRTALSLSLALGACGGHALHDAVARGDVARAERALADGAGVDDRDEDGLTGLALAARYGRLDMVRLLLARGARVDGASNGSTALMRTERAEVAAALLDAGAHIDARDSARMTPLMLAARSGSVEVAALLIQRKAGLDLRDARGRTVVHYAASENSVALVGALLAAGAPANVADLDGNFPLHLVGVEGGPPAVAIVEALLRAGNPVGARNAAGRTPICMLAGAEARVRDVLLAAGAVASEGCEREPAPTISLPAVDP